MAPRSILVPFDGSPASRAALAHAVDVAARNGGRVTLLGIVPEQPLGFGGAFIVPPVLVREELEAELTRLIEEAVDDLRARGVPACGLIRRGGWAEHVLLRVAAAEHDLVVVCERRGRLSRWLHPSRARLAARSPVPVIALRLGRRPRMRRALRALHSLHARRRPGAAGGRAGAA